MSLSIALAKYWEEHAQFLKSKETIKGHCRELRDFLGANTYLHEITADKLKQFKVWRKSNCVARTQRLISNATINKTLEIYRSVYNIALSEWKVEVAETNFKTIMFPTEDRNVSYLTQDQIDDIIRNTNEYHAKVMIQFAFMTGQRWSNISNCKWDDIDMNKRIIRFRVKSVKKQGKLLYFEIYDELYNFLLKLEPKPSGYLFTKNGWPIKSIRRTFKSACKRSGINLPRGQNVHILRHSAITYMLSQNIPPHVVKDIVGHEDINTTMQYTHVVGNIKRGWLNNAYRAQNGHKEKN